MRTAFKFVERLKNYIDDLAYDDEILEKQIIADMVFHGFNPRDDQDVKAYWNERLSYGNYRNG